MTVKHPDDYSRYVFAWQLCIRMSAEEAKQTIEAAIRIRIIG